MIQYIWLAMRFSSILWGAVTNRLYAVGHVWLENAYAAAKIALGLIGIMTKSASTCILLPAKAILLHI